MGPLTETQIQRFFCQSRTRVLAVCNLYRWPYISRDIRFKYEFYVCTSTTGSNKNLQVYVITYKLYLELFREENLLNLH